MKKTPFNLEAALAGDPVVTRDGRAVTQLTLYDIPSTFKVVAVVDGQLESFSINGKSLFGIDVISKNDLFMAPKNSNH